MLKSIPYKRNINLLMNVNTEYPVKDACRIPSSRKVGQLCLPVHNPAMLATFVPRATGWLPKCIASISRPVAHQGAVATSLTSTRLTATIARQQQNSPLAQRMRTRLYAEGNGSGGPLLGSVGFIGCGNMAEALAVGLINGGAVDAQSVFVYDRNPPKI